MNHTRTHFTWLLVSISILCVLHDASAADLYNTSRAPLQKTPFLRLPLGSVKPQGWLKQQLVLQTEGLTGHAEELYGDIGNAKWIGGSDASWERGPYYAKGLVPLAYLLDDAALIKKSQKWIDHVLKSQRDNGDFGPRNRNWWPNMIVMYYMRDYYEATKDKRVLPFMKKYFQFQMENLAQKDLNSESGWAMARGGDNIDIVLWLYNETGDAKLLELADLLDSQTNDWTAYYFTGKGKNWRPDHIVNCMQGLKRPPLWYLRSGKKADRDAFTEATGPDGWLMQTYGRIDGMVNGSEPLSNLSSTEGTELCAIVERILSTGIALRIVGDPVIGDQLERVAYNALPATLKYDIKGLRYYSLVNAPKNTNELLGFKHNGKSQHAITPSPHSGYGCCRSNFHFGWPKFVQHMWMATSDRGLAVAAYGPSQVTAKVGGGTSVMIDQVTDYPFRDTITMKVSTAETVTFPLKLRIPAWCKKPVIKVNGTAVNGVKPGTYHPISRKWSNGDTVSITFPMEMKSSVWINNSVGLERGPLVYSLLIQESWKETTEFMGGQFKTEEITATSPWNYGLTLPSLAEPGKGISVVETPMPIQPFKASQAPIRLTLDAKLVPTWGKFRKDLPGRAEEPPLSPLVSNKPIRKITLVPFGSTELRITYFPYVGKDVYSKFKFPITAQSGYGGTISPCGDVVVPVESKKTFTITPLPGCKIKDVVVDGKSVGAVSKYTFKKVSPVRHTITARFTTKATRGSVPKKGDLLLALDASALPKSGMIQSWPTAVPAGGEITRISSPTAETIDGQKFANIFHPDSDGFLFKEFDKPIPCTGASVVMVVKPIRGDYATGWASAIDVFYDRLVLGVAADTGKVNVRVNGTKVNSETVIPDGQTTILSLIVQPSGEYKVYANGVEVISHKAPVKMTSLAAGAVGAYGKSITIGRNAPDPWTTFNGKIGDLFLYKTALSDADRKKLEAHLIGKLLGK